MDNAKKILLYGAGSSIIVDIEETCRRCNIHIVAIVKNYDCISYAINQDKILNVTEIDDHLLQLSFVFPLFTPGHRKYAYEEAMSIGAKVFGPLVDPTAILPQSIDISEGVYVNSGVTIGAATFLGAFSFINRGASLGHHATISEFVSIGPGVNTGGQVLINRGAVIGTGAVILPNISVGANSVVGAGAVVTRDVPDNSVVVGNPARISKQGIVGYNGVGI